MNKRSWLMPTLLASLIAGGFAVSPAYADQTTVIHHQDGSTTTVNTNSRDTQVIHSTGGGGQYGSSHSHDEVVKEHTRSGDTTSSH